MSTCFVFALFCAVVLGSGVYLHNPRGSNNRLDESDTFVQNSNRLFNSQNNARGGYGINVHSQKMYFFESSVLSVEWTTTLNANDCSADRADCTTILQYMCGSSVAPLSSQIRDGESTTTINEINHVEQVSSNAKYGMHESLQYFKRCETRKRNGGLFTADRNLNGDNAQFTRQNNGGSRYGFECAEEREYFPYWHPSPWKDVAVVTNHLERCEYYKQTSKSARGQCSDNNETVMAWQFNSKQLCEEAKFQWIESTPSSSAIDCLADDEVSTNNNNDVQRYEWTLPNRDDVCTSADDECLCIFRIRFNVSSTDYQGFGDKNGFGEFVDYRSNRNQSVIAQDARVDFGVGRRQLQLSTNTQQIARTFEDRSHVFRLKKRLASEVSTKSIVNLNVGGKRGNAVQVFPSLEYSFVPSMLFARQSTLVHIQWVGFDSNPNNGNNNGNGKAGTDRSNICQIRSADINSCICPTDECFQQAKVESLFKTLDDRMRFAFVGQLESACDSYETLMQRNGNDTSAVDEDSRNCLLLNAADAYFDGGLVLLDRLGTFHYMCTRNNNFSNRLQKGTIVVLTATNESSLSSQTPCRRTTTTTNTNTTNTNCPSCSSAQQQLPFATTTATTAIIVWLLLASFDFN